MTITLWHHTFQRQQLKLHHDKHHQAYVNGANAAFEKLDKARSENADVDMKAIAERIILQHRRTPPAHRFLGKHGACRQRRRRQPGGAVADMINMGFGSFERFKKEFTMAATSIEGSGWAALAVHPCIGRPLIMQIEKHNVNVYPTFNILMVLDVWEHAYYLDYKNERPKFVEAFWNIVNWDKVNKNLSLL